MKGFTCFTKSGSQYIVKYNEYDNYAKLSGGKFQDVDIVKPDMISKGFPLEVRCLDTPNNARQGLSSIHKIQTSPLINIYQIRDDIQMENDVGFER